MSSSESLTEQFSKHGQAQVFAYCDALDPEQQKQLFSQAEEIDLSEVDNLVKTLVKAEGAEKVNLAGLEPSPYIPLPRNGGDPAAWKQAFEAGEEALRAGRVALFTVAGGQGTRLGYDGPKGTFPVTPVRGKTLFNVFANKVLAASRRYGEAIPWFIMTSHANHDQTVQYFKENDYHGLNASDVFFFRQGRMPAVDYDGKIMLEAKDSIAMSPDGHGGSLRALHRSGALEEMRQRGIDVISYFQVDNPLVRIVDPAFIGFHILKGSEMSSKMIPKAYPLEKLGHFCVQDGKLVVIEYSDLPEDMQHETDSNGELRYKAGSIAIHILSRQFVERAGGDPDFALPFHRADKKITTIDENGNPVKPDNANGIKFEMFVFDALPFSNNPVVIETAREDDFSPVKNKTGIDSAESSRDDQIRQWTRWLKAAGEAIETDESGLPDFRFEVSPLFADCEAAFVSKWKTLDPRPAIKEGAYLE